VGTASDASSASICLTYDTTNGSRSAGAKIHRSVDLISDAVPFGRLWHGKPNAVSSAYLLTGIKPSASRSLTGIGPTRVHKPVVTSHVSSHR
jgi:hypothetical protein